MVFTAVNDMTMILIFKLLAYSHATIYHRVNNFDANLPLVYSKRGEG